MTWFATGGLVFNPLYGKLDFSSEFAMSFHLYLVAGAGVANYRYSVLDHTIQDPAFGGNFGKVDTDYGTKVSYYFGGGLKFHLAEHIGLRIEVRDIFFYDNYNAQWKPAGTEVQEKTMKDFAHNVFFRMGVSYAF
jgi:outer membrane beta-barrel protein